MNEDQEDGICEHLAPSFERFSHRMQMYNYFRAWCHDGTGYGKVDRLRYENSLVMFPKASADAFGCRMRHIPQSAEKRKALAYDLYRHCYGEVKKSGEDTKSCNCLGFEWFEWAEEGDDSLSCPAVECREATVVWNCLEPLYWKQTLLVLYLDEIGEGASLLRIVNFSGLNVDEVGRDLRRWFSDEDKNVLLKAAVSDGKSRYQCSGCGEMFPKSKLQVDHIYPWSFGGSTELSNAQLLCKNCNSRKRDKLL